MKEGYQTYVIDDAELKRIYETYPNLWKDQEGVPERVFLGCPHMSYGQYVEWGTRIVEAMEKAGKDKIATPTYFFGFAQVRAAYVDVMISGSDSGVCKDHDNPDLYNHDLKDKIVCIPQTIGSSSAACLFMIILERNLAPKAMLFANHIDSLAACGLLMGDNWLGKRIVTVDLLGDPNRSNKHSVSAEGG